MNGYAGLRKRFLTFAEGPKRFAFLQFYNFRVASLIWLSVVCILIKLPKKRSPVFVLVLWGPMLLSLGLPYSGRAGNPSNEEQSKLRKIQGGVSREKESTMTNTDRFTEEEGKFLLSVARKTIEERLFHGKNQKEEASDFSPSFTERRGTFVTLTKQGNLRGCIGHIVPQESVMEGIRINAINAAFRDPRFRPLSPEEWGEVKIEISILTDPKPLSYSDSKDLLNTLRPGIDGVIIKEGVHQATFLPQVWEQLPNKEDFLTHLCLKAGLGGDEWRTGKLEVLTYQVQAFEE